MKWFEKIEGGVRKFHSWGYSEVYADSFVDCFSDEELDEVILHLTKLKNAGALSQKEVLDLDECVSGRRKRKGKV